MADKVLNIGFIGNGKGTNRYHAPFSLALPDRFRVKTVQARHIDHAAWPAIPGAEYTTDMAALLADPEIDVVEISTPTTPTMSSPRPRSRPASTWCATRPSWRPRPRPRSSSRWRRRWA